MGILGHVWVENGLKPWHIVHANRSLVSAPQLSNEFWYTFYSLDEAGASALTDQYVQRLRAGMDCCGAGRQRSKSRNLTYEEYHLQRKARPYLKASKFYLSR